jgi:hypothetical protein
VSVVTVLVMNYISVNGTVTSPEAVLHLISKAGLRLRTTVSATLTLNIVGFEVVEVAERDSDNVYLNRDFLVVVRKPE